MRFRAFIPLLIGIMASLVGFMTVALLRQNRCEDAAGRWNAGSRVCTVDGAAMDVARAADVVAAVVLAIVLAFMLYRASTFVRRFRESAHTRS